MSTLLLICHSSAADMSQNVSKSCELFILKPRSVSSRYPIINCSQMSKCTCKLDEVSTSINNVNFAETTPEVPYHDHQISCIM